MSDDEDDHDMLGGGSNHGGKDKSVAVRKRISKACDHCRKSKCKCERASPSEPCRSCIASGTECTFGPTRKRGPSKGYIDAIEARLHQTEALVGILLAAANASVASHDDGDDMERGGRGTERQVDERARALRGVLDDLAEDPLARSILARIDQSTYGPTGRAAAGASSLTRSPSGSGEGTDGDTGQYVCSFPSVAFDADFLLLSSPSHEWIDRVTARVLRPGVVRHGSSSSSSSNSHSHSNGNSHLHDLHRPQSHRGTSSSRFDPVHAALHEQEQLHRTPPASSPHASASSPRLHPPPNGLYAYAPQSLSHPPHAVEPPPARTSTTEELFAYAQRQQQRQQQQTAELRVTPGIW
ncbi:hypothetical protein C8R47DRAFT_737770 [Mycena vitilis]|nr:hypothetical protein C8R47DRAFT_737770 [Mycena vitilis]